jgi:hypothetical protein
MMSKNITIKNFMEVIKYKINDVCQFMWDCYGQNAYILDSYRNNGSLQIIFDLKNQTVYEFSVCDYKANKAYKWINPKFERKRKAESKNKGFTVDQAWDETNYQPTSVNKLFNFAKSVSNMRDFKPKIQPVDHENLRWRDMVPKATLTQEGKGK